MGSVFDDGNVAFWHLFERLLPAGHEAVVLGHVVLGGCRAHEGLGALLILRFSWTHEYFDLSLALLREGNEAVSGRDESFAV